MQEEQAQITRSFKAAKVREYRNHRNWFVFFVFIAAMWTFAPGGLVAASHCRSRARLLWLQYVPAQQGRPNLETHAYERLALAGTFRADLSPSS
jgi:hypothetical protein